MKPRSSLLLAMLVTTLAPLEAMAADADGSAGATFFSGVELDNEDSRRFDLGMALRSRRDTTFDLVGSRTEAESDSLDFSSNTALGNVSHDFGRYGVGLGVRHTRIEDLTETLGWLGSAFVDFASARLTASVVSHGSDFDDAPFTASGDELGLTNVTSATGTAACSVDSRGYGLGLNVIRSKWSLYGSGMVFDYSSYDCVATLSSTTTGTSTTPAGPGRAPISVSRPQTVTDLASGVTDRFSGYSSSLLPREAALLESSLMMGAGFTLGSRSTLGVELYANKEEFAQSQTNTVLGYFSIRLTPTLSADFNVGTTETDLLDDTLFAGVRISANRGD